MYKFEELYPEFGGSDIVEQHLKECPICNMLFKVYKDLKEKQQTQPVFEHEKLK